MSDPAVYVLLGTAVLILVGCALICIELADRRGKPEFGAFMGLVFGPVGVLITIGYVLFTTSPSEQEGQR